MSAAGSSRSIHDGSPTKAGALPKASDGPNFAHSRLRLSMKYGPVWPQILLKSLFRWLYELY